MSLIHQRPSPTLSPARVFHLAGGNADRQYLKMLCDTLPCRLISPLGRPGATRRHSGAVVRARRTARRTGGSTSMYKAGRRRRGRLAERGRSAATLAGKIRTSPGAPSRRLGGRHAIQCFRLSRATIRCPYRSSGRRISSNISLRGALGPAPPCAPAGGPRNRVASLPVRVVQRDSISSPGSRRQYTWRVRGRRSGPAAVRPRLQHGAHTGAG